MNDFDELYKHITEDISRFLDAYKAVVAVNIKKGINKHV